MGTARIIGLALVGLWLAASCNIAAADEITRVHALILRNPTDTQLNLRYARLAEARGEIRKALSAYERILANDPDNEEARRELTRVLRKLQPNFTQLFAELGGLWESNPRRVAGPGRAEFEAIARAFVRDERALGDLRWRTTGTFVAEAHQRNTDLNYGYAGALTGPVIDLTPRLVMIAGLGGGAAYFNRRFLYAEAIASLAFESYLAGALQSVIVRGAYRDYNNFFPSSEGFYGDVTGRFIRPDVFGSDILVFTSWVRWSDISGNGITITFEQVQPGKYLEYGSRLEYYRRMIEWLTLGGNVGVLGRDYRQSFNLVTGLPSQRRDVTVYPGATAVLHGLVSTQVDIRFDYRYEYNHSSDPLRSYVNHMLSMMFVGRF